MNEPLVTVVGNLVADPEMKMSKAGKPWVSFRVASTPRVKDQAGQWGDGEPLWLGCRAFGSLAENIGASLMKGMRVVMQGRLSANTYTDKSGQERSGLNFDVDAIGPDLMFATVQVFRKEGNGGSQWAGASQNQSYGANSSPWGASSGGDGFAPENGFGGERPF